MKYCNPCTFEVYKFEPKHITVQMIIDLVCEVFKVSFKSIRTKDRHKRHVFPRVAAIKLILEFTNSTQVYVGKLFNRDHSTIIYARDEFKATKDFTIKYEGLKNKLNAFKNKK